MKIIEPDFSTPADHHAEIKRLAAGRPIQLIMDVGANIGVTVARFLRHFPVAEVIAVEPVQPAYVALTARVGSSPRVCCMNLALSDQPGTATMHHQRHWGFNSLHPAINRPDPECMTTEEVQIMTLDQIVEGNAIEHIDILKLDTEHLDVAVLRGGINALREKRITFIYSEVTFDPLDEQHTSFAEFSGFVTLLGFEPVGFYEPNFHDSPGRLEFCNALFVRSDYLKP